MMERGDRRGGRARRLLAVAMALLAGGGVGAGCAEAGFDCGREVPGEAGVFRRCDRANEVCVCHTNSCARRVKVSETDAGISVDGADAGARGEQGQSSSIPEAAVEQCPTGLRYVEAPFARADLAGKCVPAAHRELSGSNGILSFAEAELICPGSPVTQSSSSRDRQPEAADAATPSGPSGPAEAGEPARSDASATEPGTDASSSDAALADSGSEGGAP